MLELFFVLLVYGLLLPFGVYALIRVLCYVDTEVSKAIRRKEIRKKAQHESN